MESRLHLPPGRIDRARELASRIVAPVQEFIDAHTTVTVERATLRLAGADGADADGVPVPNLVVDQLRERLDEGALKFWVNALLRTGEDVAGLNRKVAEGLKIDGFPLADPAALDERAAGLVTACSTRVKGNRALREERLAKYAGKNHAPLLYVIVATGNIHEDVKQARAAAEQGADVVAVIRTTAQTLLDYVPYGATTEGFGGTYATQENFRIMRAALDEVVETPGPLHPPDQLRLGPLHAGDRGHGGARAPRHDAERLDVRHPLPRHQHVPHVRRPEVQPDDQRLRRHHHQHRRGQLPDDVRRRREGVHGPREPVPERALRLRRRPASRG